MASRAQETTKQSRRGFILAALLAASAEAQDTSGILAIFAPLASALSSGDGEAFLKLIDPKMPDFAKLRENILALLARFDVTSSIELSRADGDTVELDWYLQLHSKQPAGASERRRQNITARLEKKRIVSIEPIAFFAPTTN